ncbi:hypothetical protein RRG08_022145 [Elysia crispata]|uniref:Uncharacterized protein n=1 Tax=Elysia crispata TaxID=231223 RepID=A0AAE1AHP9_9GAST|nr:hypothetical protein RRG08_022145 [Elysia crispata]
MLEQDIIRPSSSPYCSPITVVAKPDGSIRLCIDFRKLNSVTIFDNEPIPQMDEMTAQQFTESLDRMLNTLDTSLSTSHGTLRPLWPMILLCYQLSSVIGSQGPRVVFGYKGILLIFGISLNYEAQSMEDRVREPNHKLQEEENLHTCNLITTSKTLLAGPSTNVTTTPAADDEG